MPATEIDPIWFGGNALCAFIGGEARNARDTAIPLGLIAGARHAAGESEFLLDRFVPATAGNEKALRVFRLVNQTENVALVPLGGNSATSDPSAIALSREPLVSENRSMRFVQWRIVFVWFSRAPGAPAIEFETLLFRQGDLPERAIAAKRRSLEGGGGCVVLVLAQRELDSAPTSRDLQKGRVPQRVIEAARVVHPSSVADFWVRAERLPPETDPQIDETATCIRDYAWSETPPLHVIHVEGDIGPAEGFFVLLNRRGSVAALMGSFDEKPEGLTIAEAEQRAALHAARRFLDTEPPLPLVAPGGGAFAIGSLDGRTVFPVSGPETRESGWLEVRPRNDGRGLTARLHGASLKDEIGFFVRPGEGRALRVLGGRRGDLVTHCLFEVTEHGLVPSQRAVGDPILGKIGRHLDALPSDRPQKLLADTANRLVEILDARLSIYKEIERILSLRAGTNPTAGWRIALDRSLERCAVQRSAIEAVRRDLAGPRRHRDEGADVLAAALDDLDAAETEDDPLFLEVRRIVTRPATEPTRQPANRSPDRLHLAANHLARNFEAGRTLLDTIRKSADRVAGGLAATQFERNFSEALERIWQDMPEFLDRDLHTRFHFDREPNASDAFVLFAASAFAALARKTDAAITTGKAGLTDSLTFGDFFRHPALVEAILTQENLRARLLDQPGARIEEPNAELAVQMKHALGLGSRGRQPSEAQVEP